MVTTTVSDARNNLPDLLNRVGYGQERILLERHGKPVAAIISPEDLKRLEAIEDAIDSAKLRRAVEENDDFVTLESIIAKRDGWMSERYALRIAKTAEKELLSLQNKQFTQVAKKIFSLQANPRPQDSSELKGYAGGYRVDQGEYRILYTIDNAQKMVNVFRVGKRNDDEVYRNL